MFTNEFDIRAKYPQLVTFIILVASGSIFVILRGYWVVIWWATVPWVLINIYIYHYILSFDLIEFDDNHMIFAHYRNGKKQSIIPDVAIPWSSISCILALRSHGRGHSVHPYLHFIVDDQAHLIQIPQKCSQYMDELQDRYIRYLEKTTDEKLSIFFPTDNRETIITIADRSKMVQIEKQLMKQLKRHYLPLFNISFVAFLSMILLHDLVRHSVVRLGLLYPLTIMLFFSIWRKPKDSIKAYQEFNCFQNQNDKEDSNHEKKD